jgi:hypothetical protein
VTRPLMQRFARRGGAWSVHGSTKTPWLWRTALRQPSMSVEHAVAQPRRDGMSASEELLSLREAARRSGVSPSRLRRLAASGTLRAQKAGTYWVVAGRDLEAFMQMERPRGVRAAARQKRARAEQLTPTLI